MNRIKKILNKINQDDKKIIKILFLFSLFFYLLIGILITYNFDFSENFNLLFESDTARVIGDITEFNYNHYRLSVHPLFVLLVNPIYNIVKGFAINKMLSLVIISSIVSSLSVIFIYKISSLYNKTKAINILTSLCYLFSFSNYIFTAGIEIYNIAALFLIILWYYTLKNLKNKTIKESSMFIFVTLGILSVGFTITNFAIFLIIILLLVISKKLKLKQCGKIVFFVVVMSINLIALQFLIYHNTPVVTSKSVTDEKQYADFKITVPRITNVIKNDYYYSIIGNDIYVKSLNNRNYNGKNFVITFNDKNLITISIVTIFYILLITLFIRNYRKNTLINTSLVLSLLFNTGLHTLYGNNSTFLYSLHFLYLFLILFTINLSYEQNKTIKKISQIYLTLLIIFELIINSVIFIKLIKIVKTILTCNYYVANFGMLKTTIAAIILIAIIMMLIISIIKQITKYKNSETIDNKCKYIVIGTVLSILTIAIFITLETSITTKQILWYKFNTNKNKDVYLDANYYVIFNKATLEDIYSNEFIALKNYISEYKLFSFKYKHEKVKFLNKIDYYFFGFGNRKKLLYKDNSLIDLSTGDKLYTFNTEEYIIIPNLYTVLIKTKEGNYIKIYEDSNGIHYNMNNVDNMIDNTKINLYDFKGEKYENIKKVLYGEILFNIKDSKIYPNILVYDNPWYRDAAIASMVLKRTNNTDLISDWVSNIKDIYDMQNKGNKETDNLGELLYIISTQKDKPQNLINKIKAEADTIANNNPNGKYLYGKTDYQDMYLYQNLWYKYGLESLNMEFKYDIDKLSDNYSNMAWWSSNKVNTDVKSKVDENYPYLTIATYHKTKKGKIVINSSIYPLSWEKNASEADYQKMKVLDNYYVDNRISPLHTWTASELLLLLMDNTNKK